MWNKHIDVNPKEGEQPTKAKTDRLSQITVSMMLRREKAQKSKTTGKVFVDLPPKTITVETIGLSKAERKAYKELSENGRRRVMEILEDGGDSGMFEMLALITRMRQFCTHPALIRLAMDWESVVEGLETKPDKATMAKLDKKLDELYDPVLAKEVAKLFDVENHSSKTAAMIIKVREVLTTTPDKIVIVSQWTSVLNIVETHIKKEINNVAIVRIDGNVKLEDRANAVKHFNASGGPRIMLLSITAAGCGLNLIGGNHMILMDLHWNPANELQVYDRLHRMGQTKPVYITKYVTTNTIEDRVMVLQKEKQDLAQAVFDGTTMRTINKLTIGDIKRLFGIDDVSKANDAGRVDAVGFRPVRASKKKREKEKTKNDLLKMIGTTQKK